ncbi:AAA family ATPase [Frankia sp. Mgl5]|uniref:BTAD domain-containing putative transcriptional regulator n=1 Tax=Frankia sp. Mgl5 TaxID=2933793 RepID=UPI00200EAA8D|nr:BTAD domain-containing putative transcriptional regulator [Frankia sp. Mgl5]MCK9931009.1 AAA family ATPase [Frankia sp. Mgl5]
MRGVPYYRLFGPIEVVRDGRPVQLGGPKQRAVLAALLLDAGRVVSVDRLAGAVWGDEHPPSMLSSLHAHISNLRRLLRDDERATSPIVRRTPGYLADVPPDDLDLRLFERECDRAQAAADTGDWPDAVAAADRAAALRRGPLLAEFGDESWVRGVANAVDERWAQCERSAVVGLLGSGRITAAVLRSRQLVHDAPLAEHACHLHMIALYRAGRAAEALDAFRDHARRLADELGLEASPALRDLQGAILRQDPALDSWPASPRTADRATPTDPANASTRPTNASIGPATSAAAAHAGNPIAANPIAADAARTAAPTTMAGSGTSEGEGTPGVRYGELVGRVREIAVLDSVLSEAMAGPVRWVVLTGPAGIGKSRLAEEAAAGWHRAGGAVSRTGCPDDDAVPPWWPVRQLLRDLGADPDDLLTPPSGADADAARFVVYGRVLDALSEAARTRPLLVVAEDVHWADTASLRLLTHLADAGACPGLALVVTARDVTGRPELDRLLAAAARRHGSRRLAVPPLTEGEVSELVNRISGQAIDDAEAAELADRTSGNPFFVCEYARLPAEDRAGGKVPVAVRSVLGQRLAILDPAVLQVLRAAAVIGDVLDIDLLGKVTRLDRDELADLLDEASDEHVIVQAAGTGRYMFAHALLRDEVVAGISSLRRQRLHLRVAEALGPVDGCPVNGGSGGGEALSRRAAHLAAAWPLAESADVFDACRAAALDAERRWQSEAAARWWGQALDVLDRSAGDLDIDRDEVLIARVSALARAGRGQTVLDVVDAGLLDAVRRGRLDSAGRLAATLLRTSGSWPWAVYGDDPAPLLARLAGLETLVAADPAAHVRVLAALAVGSAYDPDGSVPDLLSRRAIELAERIGDDEALADALLARAVAFSGIAERAAESVELLNRLATVPHASAQIDEVIAHGLLYLAKTELGDPGSAEHVRLGALGSDLLRLPASRVQFRWAQGSLALWRDDDLSTAEEIYHHAFALHRETELYESGAYHLALLALWWEQGRLDNPVEPDEPVPVSPFVPWAPTLIAVARGEPDADKLLIAEIAQVEPVTWTTHSRLTMLAHAVADLGLRSQVATLTARLTPVAHCVANVGQCGYVGTVALALARLAALDGDLPGAREHLRTAVEVSTRAQGVGALLRCRLFAAELAALAGDPVDLDDLRDVADRAARRGMIGVARDARALLTRHIDPT